MLYTLTVFLSLSWHAVGSSCNGDNCLNALRGHASSASSFCTPYLASTYIATTGIPTILSACSASPSKLSSACSCILPSVTSSSVISSTSSAKISSTSASICTATTTITPLASTVTVTQSASCTVACPTCPSISSPSSSTTICTATTTITPLASTITVTQSTSCAVASLTCPSPSTITSVSTVTTTTTEVAIPTCSLEIVGGNFSDPATGSLTGWTISQSYDPEDGPWQILNTILSDSEENAVEVPAGINQFYFISMNNENIPPWTATVTTQLDIGMCAFNTLVQFSATVFTNYQGGSLSFCISPDECSLAQTIDSSDAAIQYIASFVVVGGETITATLNIIASNIFNPSYVVGIADFSVLTVD